MLVLLIMFIITIPAATHKVPLDLPIAGPPAPAPAHQPPSPPAAPSPGTARRCRPPPCPRGWRRSLPIRRPHPAPSQRRQRARFEQVDQVLAQIRAAGVTTVGLVDNERYRRAFWQAATGLARALSAREVACVPSARPRPHSLEPPTQRAEHDQRRCGAERGPHSVEPAPALEQSAGLGGQARRPASPRADGWWAG